MNEKNGKYFFIIICTVFVILTIYTVRKGKKVENNKQSEDKITSLHIALETLLGYNWPYVLTFIFILFFTLFYVLNTKEVNITLTENGEKNLYKAGIFLGIVLIILVCILSYNLYKKREGGSIPNYTGTTETERKKVLIVVLIIFILFSGGFILRKIS